MKSLVSIVTPYHNREAFLGQALQSLLNQTIQDFEVILWNDGSTDASESIVQKMTQGDPRFRCLGGQRVGHVQALVRSCAQARGHFLGFLDSDDWLEPTALEETLAQFEENDQLGMVYTDHFLVDAEGLHRGLGRRCRIPYSKERLLLDFMTFHFRLMRREDFETVGGLNPDFPYAMDYDLCLRLSETTTITHLRRPLYAYRVHPQALSVQMRLDQIRDAHRAVQVAMTRRGMEDHVCQLEVSSRHIIRKVSGHDRKIPNRRPISQ